MTQRDRDKWEEPKGPTLPVFNATKSKDFPGFLIVFCPREDCVGTAHERPFIVHQWTWMRPDRIVRSNGQATLITGRSCPYCFRVARLPRRSTLR